MREFEAQGPRVAVYVAGDERIFFPALVTLLSIQRHNAHLPFDYYMCFSREKLTGAMRQALHDRGISFVAREEFAALSSAAQFQGMSEGKWPPELFDNWVAPHYFESVGYKYALKVDYDVLCLAPYEYQDLLSASTDFRSVVFRVDLAKQHVKLSAISRLGLELSFPFESAPYTNVGFMALNLENYVGRDIFDRFARTYRSLRNEDSGVLLCEQAAVSVLLATGEVSYAPINPNYNVRAITLPPIDADGRADIRNLHYVTHHKPWLPPDYRWFDKYVPTGKTSVYLYRDLWLRAAARDPLFVEYVDVDPDDELAALAPLIKVLRAHVKHKR